MLAGALYYRWLMTKATRLSVAQQLAPLGLRNTLIAVERDGAYVVSRIKSIGENVELNNQGNFASANVPIIGRVGVPEASLGITWTNSMAFFGKWFDHIGETDPSYRLRKSISTLSHRAQLDQIGRDEQYALVGSYYSVFRTILEVKQRAPLVLVSDSLVPLRSFPVILPAIEDDELQAKFIDVLGFMLRRDNASQQPAEPDPLALDGIVVEEE